MRRLTLCCGLGVLVSLLGSPAAAAPLPDDDASIVHLLERAAYGPRPGDVDRVRRIGVAAWLTNQLRPGALDDSAADRALAGLTTLGQDIPELLRDFPRPDPRLREKVARGAMTGEDAMRAFPRERRPAVIVDELRAAKLVRAVASERQLLEVMVDFWFNHFNVSARKGQVRWYVGSYERDTIRPHALGRFRDLLAATASHPAMLFYLDNWLSTRPDFTLPGGPDPGRRAGLNENYARELLELHTLGVDGGYRQEDVREVARVFTGWTIDRPATEGRFRFRLATHDLGTKIVLGERIAGHGRGEEGLRVLALLARHPSTARLVAGKLARRFVADDPPPALVDRAAAAYARTDGDIGAVLEAIFRSPEFWAPEARGAKVKKPLEFVASAARALDARIDARGGLALARAVAEIGEPLYEASPPTGHPDAAAHWVSAGALLARMNVALALTASGLPGVSVDVGALARDSVPGENLDGRATDVARAALALGAPGFQRR